MKTLFCSAGLLTWLGFALILSAADPAPPATKPFLGVHTVSVPREVRAQTVLEEDEGLMIDFIQPDSPAAHAGFKLYDILTNVADQKLLSADQFSILIKSSKSGQLINIGILRQGKPLTLEATLVEAPVQDLTPSVIAGSGRDLLADAPDARQSLSLLLKQLDNSRVGPKTASGSSANLSMSDPKGAVEIVRKDNHQTATVKDPNGKILFEGPLDTPAERDALDLEIRARIEKLEQSVSAIHPRGE